MNNAPDDEPNDYLEPVGDEIVDNVEEVANVEEMVPGEHEEVLEEIVHDGEVMYDAEGRIIEYQDVVIYENDAEVIEEYVEVEEIGNGEYAYVVTDEDGVRRFLKPEEIDTVKKEGLLMEEEDIDKSTVGADGEGPSSSNSYPPKRPRQILRTDKGHIRPTMREMMKDSMLYNGYYHENQQKRINDVAKIDVEKFVPQIPVNRRPLPESSDFKQGKQRARKNPPWRDEIQQSPVRAPAGPSPDKIINSLLSEDDEVPRFKCPECADAFSSMEKHCQHISKNHDCPAMVREVEFFAERDFDTFFSKLERTSQIKEHGSVIFAPKKKSRQAVTQTFICNYMNKGRAKYSEFQEVNLTALADRPQEFCTAFVQKTSQFECIRVHYCDQHIHFDGNIGYRVPLTVKRRLFEMSFKRIPVPCMQVILNHEADTLVPSSSRFMEKLKNFSHVEIIELLGIIVGSLRKFNEPALHLQRSKKVAIKFDTVNANGLDTLVVRRLNPPSRPLPPMRSEVPSTSEMNYALDVPTVGREIELEEEEEDLTVCPEGADGLMDEGFLYDPENDRDPLIDELTETELGVLEAYERDIQADLTEAQKQERIRTKCKFALAKVCKIYQSLDSATHGIVPTEIHNESIGSLREMASFVVELACQLDAEIKAQFNPSLRVDEIKRDMIAGIALQERTCAPDKRRAKPICSGETFRSARSHEVYQDRTFLKRSHHHRQNMLLNYEVTAEMRHMEMLRSQHLEQMSRGEQKQEEKPVTMGPPDQVPWFKRPARRESTGPPRKKRQYKKDEPSTSTSTSSSTAEPEPTPQTSSTGLSLREAMRIAQKQAKEKSAQVLEELVEQEKESHQREGGEQATAPEAEEAQEPEAEAPETSEDVKPEIGKNGKTKERERSSSRPLFHWPKDDKAPEEAAPPTKTRTGRVVKPKKWGDE